MAEGHQLSTPGIMWLIRSYTDQPVKNRSAMRETWVRSLGWEDPLEKGKATHSSILACRIPWTVYIVHGVAMNVQTATFTFRSCSSNSQSPALQESMVQHIASLRPEIKGSKIR